MLIALMLIALACYCTFVYSTQMSGNHDESKVAFGDHFQSRVHNDLFVHRGSNKFPYEKQLANEFQMVEPQNIAFGLKDDDSYILTRVYPLTIKNDDIVTVSFSSTDPWYTGNFLLIYICNSHVLSHLLLMYISKLHWNLNTMFLCQVISF